MNTFNIKVYNVAAKRNGWPIIVTEAPKFKPSRISQHFRSVAEDVEIINMKSQKQIKEQIRDIIENETAVKDGEVRGCNGAAEEIMKAVVDELYEKAWQYKDLSK